MADADPTRGRGESGCGTPRSGQTPTGGRVLRLVRQQRAAFGPVAAHFAHLAQRAISQHLRVSPAQGCSPNAARALDASTRCDPTRSTRSTPSSPVLTDALTRLEDIVDATTRPTETHRDRPRPLPDPLMAGIRIAAPPDVVSPPHRRDAAGPAGSATPAGRHPNRRRLRTCLQRLHIRPGQFVTIDPPKRVVFTWGSPTTTSYLRFDHRRDRAHPDETRPSSARPPRPTTLGSTQPPGRIDRTTGRTGASPETTGDAIPTARRTPRP